MLYEENYVRGAKFGNTISRELCYKRNLVMCSDRLLQKKEYKRPRDEQLAMVKHEHNKMVKNLIERKIAQETGRIPTPTHMKYKTYMKKNELR